VYQYGINLKGFSMSIYAIDRESDIPLYIQIRDRITAAITDGQLRPGDRLPPVAALAKEIGVTQATIRRALQDLRKAGHTSCHVGRGTFILDASTPEAEISTVEKKAPVALPMGRETGRWAPRQVDANPLELAARRLRAGVSKALYDIMPLAHKAEIIQLTKGIPDPGLLPEQFLEEITAETLRDGGADYLGTCDALGLPALREEIARRFSQAGARITPEQIMITNGSIQALTLVAQAAMENRPGILCETPCFQGIVNSFTAMGHWVDTVRRDAEGPRMDELQRLAGNHPHLLYLCPYAHNPTGIDLSPQRAAEITEWARQTGSIVIADEIFKEIRYQTTCQPSLLETLGCGQTIVISSLSKSVACGLRLGWLISSPERIRQLGELKRNMDHCTPPLIQGMALTLLTNGVYDAHTAKMRAIYQRRMDTLVGALEKHMPQGITWMRPQGGFSILVELPRGYSSVALLLTAIDRGVSFLPGPLFDIDQRYVNALRLSVAWADRHQIKEGIELLASAIDDFIQQPPGDSGLSGLGNYQ
jgi:DNA-binding transcriptional MocR family regulator